MTSFDYLVIAVLVISTLVGFMRGAVKEIFGLLAWIAAFTVGINFTVDFAPILPKSISNESVRAVSAFVILFLITWLFMSLLTVAVSRLVTRSELWEANRMLGVFFGLIRGLALILMAVSIAGMTALPKDKAWRDAALSAPFETTITMLKPWMPDDFAKRIKFK
jgi:membrane protein required for colicin V production